MFKAYVILTVFSLFGNLLANVGMQQGPMIQPNNKSQYRICVDPNGPKNFNNGVSLHPNNPMSQIDQRRRMVSECMANTEHKKRVIQEESAKVMENVKRTLDENLNNPCLATTETISKLDQKSYSCFKNQIKNMMKTKPKFELAVFNNVAEIWTEGDLGKLGVSENYAYEVLKKPTPCKTFLTGADAIFKANAEGDFIDFAGVPPSEIKDKKCTPCQTKNEKSYEGATSECNMGCLSDNTYSGMQGKSLSNPNRGVRSRGF